MSSFNKHFKNGRFREDRSRSPADPARKDRAGEDQSFEDQSFEDQSFEDQSFEDQSFEDQSFEDQARERYRLLQPFLKGSVGLPQLAEHHGVSLRTMRRWACRYREEGLAGLQRKTRSDRGTRRPETAQWKEVIEALSLKRPRVPIAAIHRRVARLAGKKGLAAPSYSTVYDIAGKVDPGLQTLAHEGEKAYAQAYELLYRRETDRPNEVWQADHTCLPILVYDEKGTAAKPWLTVIEDDYSRAICGYVFSMKAPTAMRTALALRQAIWRKTEAGWPVCGIPEVLYVDHGSDFTSRHIEHVCIDLKTELIFSTVGKPRGRGRIERFFRTIEQLFLTEQPGYAPDGHLKTAEAAMELSALDRRFREFLIQGYHLRPHGTTGHPPAQRWSEGGFLPRLPESLEALDELLLTVARPRKVHRDGIRFQTLRYIDPVLAAYVGEDVTVRYDPRDLTEVRIYHEEGFLCRAVCQELAGETVSLRDITSARRQRKHNLKKTLARRRSLLDVILEKPTFEKPTFEKSPLEKALPASSPPAAETAGGAAGSAKAPKPRQALKRYYHE
ncbi:putative transposase [Salinibacter ruber]|uniref:Mu transposase C-terminal domain-containing protein n=1 Tax=Salinibacter ruber TaxID=146919 RepID=UPI0021670322|nr:putative transposase [Salinibacter ruber]